MDEKINYLAKIIRQQRISIPLTLKELSAKSGVSPSHLGRIEKGERFPSGHVLLRIANALGIPENELLVIAGYLSNQSSGGGANTESGIQARGLDPYVAKVLAQEPVEVQRSVVGILSILKNLAENIGK